MNLERYSNIVIVKQEDTEHMPMRDYRAIVERADLVMADQGESNFNPDYHDYRVMKNRYGPKPVEPISLHVAEIAKALLNSVRH